MRKLFLLTILLSLVAVWPAHAQDDPCFDKGGYLDPATGQCKLAFGLSISIDYPLAVMGMGDIETRVDTFIVERRTQFITWFTEGLGYPMIAPWDLSIFYETTSTAKGYNTLIFTIYDYTGGAHGNTTFQTFTYDAVTGEVYGLFDLFQEEFDPMPTLSSLVQSQLLATMGDMTDADWIAAGTGEDPANYQNFALTDTDLIFYFPPYQVAAYAAGPQVVSIPLANLATILKPEFMP